MSFELNLERLECGEDFLNILTREDKLTHAFIAPEPGARELGPDRVEHMQCQPQRAVVLEHPPVLRDTQCPHGQGAQFGQPTALENASGRVPGAMFKQAEFFPDHRVGSTEHMFVLWEFGLDEEYLFEEGDLAVAIPPGPQVEVDSAAVECGDHDVLLVSHGFLLGFRPILTLSCVYSMLQIYLN